ncbi:MAG: hypothetical protein JST80_04620 [Bdellovibrionales bacterium]|nr:hypothetical protein [Bdellovibrionales bacterium]
MMKQLFSVMLIVLGTSAFAQKADLYGVGNDSSNLYVVRATDGVSQGMKIVLLPSSELKSVLLLKDQGAVKDTFNRVTWFDSAGKVMANQVPGAEFKLSQNFLAAYTPGAFAKVYDRTGKVLFETNRSVSGVGVVSTRFGWIDQWNRSFELYNAQGKLIFNKSFVKNAWLSDTFVVLKSESNLSIYGRNQKQFPTENLSSEVQVSNALAVVKDKSGSVKVYGPDRLILNRSNIKKVVLTSSYLALVDAQGFDIYRNDGTLEAHFQNGTSVQFGERVIALKVSTGVVTLIDPARVFQPQLAAINRADKLILGAKLAMAVNGAFYELYSLDPDHFGMRLTGGPRTIDADAQAVVGLKVYGFVNPNAKSAEVYAPPVMGTQDQRSVLSEKFGTRLDLSVDAASLNWTMF